MSFLLSAVLLTSLLMVSGHEWGIGNCPYVTSAPSFDTDMFMGTWYVIEQIDTSSECLQLQFEKTSDAQLKLTKIRQHPVLKTVGIDHTNRYSAVLDQPTNNEARMKVKWTLNPAKADYTVIDTDYSTYALIAECQNIWPRLHRYSAAILAKSDNLPTSVLNRLKRTLDSNEIDSSELSKINHQNCKTLDNPQVNIDVDRDTIRDFITTTRNGIQDISTTIADGFRTFSTTVSDAVSAVVTLSPETVTSPVTTAGTNSESSVATQSSTDFESGSTDIGIRNNDDGREPLDENPDVPVGNPDDINDASVGNSGDVPDTPLAFPEAPSSNPDANPESPSSNPDANPEAPSSNPDANPDSPSSNPDAIPESPSSNPEAPSSDPDVNPEVPDLPDANPEENTIDGSLIADVSNNNPPPVDEEENIEPVDAVIRTVVTGLKK